VISYGKQNISPADIDAVVDVLRSDYLTQGSVVPLFENRVASYCGVEYGVATNSATSALHIACLALELGKGDILWTSPNTFVASANVGMLCGAEIDFVDIDSDTYSLCTVQLENKLQQAELNGKLPKIVMPVHFAGQSCDMQKINQLAQQYGFKVVEDASHAIGASYQSGKVGNCMYSDITVFSFHPVKIITTAEGGLATTHSKKLAHKMRLLRSHGVTREVDCMEGVPEGPWYYEQIALGLNYRMTEMQAALGVSQLNRLDEFISRRHQIAQTYLSKWQALPITLPTQTDYGQSSFHLFPVLLANSKQRQEFYEFMIHRGVGVNVHYIPVHTQPYYQKRGFKFGDFPTAEDYYSRTVSIPLHPSLSDENIDTITYALHDFFEKDL